MTHLRKCERKLLNRLLSTKGQVVGRAELMRVLNRPEPRCWSNSLDAWICYLRRKVELQGMRIIGVRFQGYKLIEK